MKKKRFIEHLASGALGYMLGASTITLVILLLLAFARPAHADGPSWIYRTHATDCTAITDGKYPTICYEQDSKRLFKCIPAGGADTTCDSAGEWNLVASPLPADPSACSAGQYVTDISEAGVLSCAQVAFSQLDGSAADSQIPNNITIDAAGTAGTASNLAANGSNCSAGQAAGGVSASGVAEDCTTYLQSFSETGDVASVGDCASGACNDGTSDGGTYLALWDGTANKATLQVAASLGVDVTLTLGNIKDGTAASITTPAIVVNRPIVIDNAALIMDGATHGYGNSWAIFGSKDCSSPTDCAFGQYNTREYTIVNTTKEIWFRVSNVTVADIVQSGLFTAYKNLSVGNGSTSAGVIKILEDTDDGANYVSLSTGARASDQALVFGTFADGRFCKYTASGTLIDCNSTCADITGSADLCDGSDAAGAASMILDLGDDAGNDSTALGEIATTGDTNSIFTESSADKLLIDLSKDWPKADAADALNANGSNCSAGQASGGVSASGVAEDCTTYLQSETDAAHDTCGEISGCVVGAITAAGVPAAETDAAHDTCGEISGCVVGAITAGGVPAAETDAAHDACSEISGCVVGAITSAGVPAAETDSAHDTCAEISGCVVGAGIGDITSVGDCASGDCADVGIADDKAVYVGGSADAQFTWETTGVDHLELGLRSPMYFNIIYANDLGNASRAPAGNATDPTVRVYSADAAQAADYIEIYHNETDGVIDVGNGLLSIPTATTVSAGLLTASANLTVGNGAATAGVLTLLEDTDEGANFASFQVPALAANTVYILPADDGDAGEQLQTNGSGTLTWEAAGSGSGAPTTSDYLVVTADAGLSAEVAVGKVDDTVIVANGSTWEAKAVGDCTDTSGKHLNYTAASNSFSCGTSSSVTDTNAVKEYWFAASALEPLEAADSIPPISKWTGTNQDILAASYDASTDEGRKIVIKVPSDVQAGSTITFRVVWFARTATTGNVVWDFRYSTTGAEGETWDGALTTKAAAADAVQGTANLMTTTTITETLANLGWAANDVITVMLYRDANNGSDDMADDAQVVGVGIEIPRS